MAAPPRLTCGVGVHFVPVEHEGRTHAAPEEVDAIFSNISDLVELTITLIGSLEDTLEMAEDGQVGRFIIIICL